MSDDGEGSGISFESQKNSRKFRGNEFAPAVAKIAIAQICESEGFQGFQQSALETLSDVTVRYIRELGKTAHSHSNLAGRTACNVFDVILGLENLGLAQGFSGASDINHGLSKSGSVREITKYISITEETPFAYDLLHFPAVNDQKPTESFSQIGKEPPSKDIPAWLPAFPDPETYVQSHTQNEKLPDSSTAKIEQESQPRKERSSIITLQQRLVSNGAKLPFAVDHADVDRVKEAVKSNPFLDVPLRFGEKEVSSYVFPAKRLNQADQEYPYTGDWVMENHTPVLETSAPAIEATKSKSCDSEDRVQTVLSNGRRIVQFKIGIRERSSGSTSGISFKRTNALKVASRFEKDNEKKKKKKAELILRESMENHGEREL